MKNAFAAAVVMIAIQRAIAGTIDPAAEDSEHIEYGKQFRHAARLRCDGEAASRINWATCVVVGPRHVLTSAHVVKGRSGVTVLVEGVEFAVANVDIHEDYDSASPGRADLAVCRVESDLPFDWFPRLYAGDGEEGQVCSLAGYGLTGTFATGYSVDDGLRRAGSNVVDGVAGDLMSCSAGTSEPTTLEFLITPGDSGGPLFIGSELAGIHSFIAARKGTCPRGRRGEESFHTRISPHREWILERIK